jgi:hypothetical protein
MISTSVRNRSALFLEVPEDEATYDVTSYPRLSFLGAVDDSTPFLTTGEVTYCLGYFLKVCLLFLLCYTV